MKVNAKEVVAFVDRKAERLARHERRSHGDQNEGFRKEPRRKERRASLQTRRELLDY